ncbi:ribose 5-phosphate isomerase A [Clostridium chromiireducens]|uniref:Ribose 5-phosphate isomerase A n=1 Tax=Clostridium chromiireducens TaxID=225345 RepID=A0A964RSU7_9CLOT|nr:ribose 5-phosphate isomerase A [Clostridium chromiireducens]MVX67167.1 ribose 5-phosphate isomerase A [Clostridium chromiireducens]
MNDNDFKKICAKESIKYIRDGMVVGLGGGRTIAYLIEYIKEGNIKVKIVTPSTKTKMICIENGLEVLHTGFVDKVDVAFDGCDQVDENLNALKSGGGIHTKEKLIASMAKEYILLVDEAKVEKELSFKSPVVLEILEDSLKYVEREVLALGGKSVTRTSDIKDGFTISDNGNLLMNVSFSNVEDVYELNNSLINICGVVETSLFTNVITKVIVASEQGIRVISKY